MQERAAVQAADARLRAFDGLGTRLVVALAASLTLLVVFIVLTVVFIVTSDPEVRTMTSDFRVFWAAARLFLAGEPLAAFDASRIAGEYGEAADAWMPWLYPPGYLVLVAPFGALPYQWAYLAMTLISVAAMALATRPLAGGIKPVWAAMVLAPAYLPTLLIGQNSMVWLAVLLAALLALRDGKAVLAGVLIGCLTLKPQLGLMIPFALLAAGQWRTILAAAGTALLLAALPTLAVGTEYWGLMVERLGQHADRMVMMTREIEKIVSPFYLMTRTGLPDDTALALQGALTLGMAGSVLVFWRSARIGFDAKAALLLIAMLLSAPYLWYYEAALGAAAGLFLLRAGILRTRPAHIGLLALFWIGAGLQSANAFLHLVPDRFLGPLLVTPAAGAAFVLCWRHLLRSPRHLAAE